MHFTRTLTLYCGNPRPSTQSATSSVLHWVQEGNATVGTDLLLLSAILRIATQPNFRRPPELVTINSAKTADRQTTAWYNIAYNYMLNFIQWYTGHWSSSYSICSHWELIDSHLHFRWWSNQGCLTKWTSFAGFSICNAHTSTVRGVSNPHVCSVKVWSPCWAKGKNHAATSLCSRPCEVAGVAV